MQFLDKLKLNNERKATLKRYLIHPYFPNNSKVFIVYTTNPLKIFVFPEKYWSLFKNSCPTELEINNYSIGNITYFSTSIIEDDIIHFSEDLKKHIDFTGKDDVILILNFNTNIGILMLSNFESQYLISFEIQMYDEVGLISKIANYFTQKDIDISSSFFRNSGDNKATLTLDLASNKLLNPGEIKSDLNRENGQKIIEVTLKNIIKSAHKTENNTPIYGKVFVSYSSKDSEFTKALLESFKNKNIEFWVDGKDIKIGDNIQNKISKGLKSCDKFLLICSKHSLKSWWVERELDEALLLESRSTANILIPINLDDEIFNENLNFEKKDYLLTRRIGDFKDWRLNDKFKKSLEELLDAFEI